MAKPVLSAVALLVVVGAGALAVPGVRERLSPWLPSLLAAEPAKPKRAARRTGRPAPVRVAVAAKRDVPIHLEGVGTVKARSKVAIKPRTEGQLFEAKVREGQTVRKGDVLFLLDARPLQARLRETEAILARDRANHAKALGDVKRLTALSAKGYTPRTRLDDARTLVDTFAATVRAAEAEVEMAQLNLDYATIRSPIDGRVGSILTTPGNIVKPNDSAPLLVITETKPVYVSFSVPEQHIDELRLRMAASDLAVEVSTQARQSKAVTGRLFFINNEVDASTGTIRLLAIFENADESLLPGQFARARVRLSTLRDAVLVPSRAVQINQQGHYLWVARTDNSIELRQVVVGPADGGDTVIEKGLAAGERVVTDGQLRLFPGAIVAPSDGKRRGADGGERGNRPRGRGKARTDAEARS